MIREPSLRSLVLCSLAVTATLASGCASIAHPGPRKIPVASSPPGATVSIYDRDGKEVMKETTPFVANLRPKYKYFSGQQYRMVFEMPGYQKSEVQLRPSLSGWYWGNLAIGGALGMFIIDPNTGAMYNLSPDKVDQTLVPDTAANVQDGAKRAE
jgi:hypothetical protein